MSVHELDEDELAGLVGVCGFLCNFLDKGTWSPTEPLEDLVLATVARGRASFEVIVELAASDRPLQASMLSRSLFEDMIVAHWLVLHHESPDWLISRFNDHREAMRLNDFRVRHATGFGPSGDDVSDLLDREDELKKEFGPFAEQDWWARRQDGSKIGMSGVVRALAAADLFKPRLKGKTPVLEQYFGLQQKAWNQALHHTAAGTILRSDGTGAFPNASGQVSPFLVMFGNYWVFAQLVFVGLELGAPVDAIEHFEEQFLAGLAVFGAVADLTGPDADALEARLSDTQNRGRT